MAPTPHPRTSSPCETTGRPRTPPLPSAHLLPPLPPPAAPGGFPAPSAGPARHPCHAQSRAVLSDAVPCRAVLCQAKPYRAVPFCAKSCHAVPRRAVPFCTVPGRARTGGQRAVSLHVRAHPQHPARRSSGCDTHLSRVTCSSSLAVSELEGRVLGEVWREGWVPEGCQGSQCPLTLSSQPLPQPLCWIFRTPAALALSNFRITLKSPPSPHLHLFRSCSSGPLHPVLHSMPGSPLPELSTGLFLALVPLNPQK